MFSVVRSLSHVKVAHVGSTAILGCDSTDVVNLVWEFYSTSYHLESVIVYEHPDVVYGLKSRYSVSRNNLSINNVQLCDAGTYLCTLISGDHLGFVDFQVIVLGKQY